MKPWLLRLHRWTALFFAAPLLVLIVTGLILSFEPWLVTRSVEPASLDAAKIEALLKRHDPAGKARALSFRTFDHALTLGQRDGTIVDIRTGNTIANPSGTSGVLSISKSIHQTMLVEAGWLVLTSTIAMLVLMLLGLLMGLPRLTNTLGGWHKGLAWGALPLLILSPLTGVMLATGVTFSGGGVPAAGQPGPPPGLVEAVRLLGAKHDLSGLVWLRPRGNRMLARIVEGGEYRVLAVTKDGVQPLARNWPRLLHEGTFAGGASASMNIATSLAMLGLLATGGWIWLSRRIRMRARRMARATAG